MSSAKSDQELAASLDIVVRQDGATPRSQKAMLTRLYFGNDAHPALEGLSVQTGLELLDAGLFVQYWMTDQQVVRGQYKNVDYAHAAQMLFGLIELECNRQMPIQRITKKAYCELYQCLEKTGCRHLLRTWNFFPDITCADPHVSGQNRYETFCHGRIQAMRESNIKSKTYPAATVIGSPETKLQICFLAADAPGIAVENPRQTSAFEYPVGERETRPLFSRGIIKTWGRQTHFYVSGTASIVGHETLHADDVCAQLNEAINNVETLVTHANAQYHTRLNAQDHLLYMKIYVRQREDIARVQHVLTARLSDNTPRALLLGDMCREDLLVEVEAFYQA